MQTHVVYHFNSSVQRTGVTFALQLWLKKKRGVRADIKHT